MTVENCKANMLTGLEQYSLERAGYFIRRTVFAPEALLELANPVGNMTALLAPILPTVRDALGGRSITSYIGWQDEGMRWTRGYDIPWNTPHAAQVAELARTVEHIQARIAMGHDESLALLPGTHAMPPSAEDVTELSANLCADCPGSVCVRLNPGDVLFWNTNVIHRTGGNGGGVICVTFVTQQLIEPRAVQTRLPDCDGVNGMFP